MTAPQPPRFDGQLNIGINAHLLSGEAGYRRAGIHQYIYQVLRHLPPIDRLSYTVYTRQTEGWEDRPDMRFAGTAWPTENRLARIAWEQIAWPWRARRDGVALMHSLAFAMPRLAPCPVVVTIYDLSFVHYPDSFPVAQRRYLIAETTYSCRRAERLIAISESGRRDLHKAFGVPLERIDVVTPGVIDSYRPLPDSEVEAFRRRRNLAVPFVLHVGTLQPRKNIAVLLEALVRLRRPDVPLVLVGGKGWFYDEIFERVKTLGLAEQVRFAGYVDDAELPLWYNAARALVFPSLYEGFGMPVVEALACGTPVIVAETSSLPEAGGAAALYFDPHDPEALAAHLADVLDNDSFRHRIRREGPAQAARFAWPRAGQETVEVYRRALSLPVPSPAR